MLNKEIHFILNPISGRGKGMQVKDYILKKYNYSQFIKIKITTKKGDAFYFTQESIRQKADIIVSCGGDGTLNEVASALIGNEIPLGIIPIGSGNGFARNLKIPLNFKKALDLLLSENFQIIKVDAGKVNNHLFFSNMGIGYDSDLIRSYAKQTQRQLFAYIKCGIKIIFSFKAQTIELFSEDKKQFSGKIMLFNIANSDNTGYGLKLSPNADISDNILDVLIVKKTFWPIFILSGLGFLLKKDFLPEIIRLKFNRLIVHKKVKYIQIDGEYLPNDDEKLEVSIIHKKLSVIKAHTS